ncbi:SDR family NAD(P)-dependent oxidoreductase [Yimella sp. cx-51]|uniref:SDR family NAD(P)-dependent oxidoreductase n=1 Tax=Yimella sp. cx-51 TaxID=2770551 RepID=UPI00165E2B38|nr:SDR family NAD(P)-dependent oxidoreductase [Yimella sp. cx-51]MBC9957203.1 SDR family NAD(P)-dependent oxidoreductase [Yimella sp. cx-51]QTH37148.1 SDR family NAD(P)-dependent oxidoreductase [Yimella sp. cx-51]
MTSHDGRRVLITGAARGIGAALARRLASQGARVALTGLEPELLEAAASHCPGAIWRELDVTDAAAVGATIDDIATMWGGLDVVVANAGIAGQLPMDGGDPEVMRAHLEVNVVGCYNTLRAAAPHVSHPHGYALATASLAAAVHAPLMGAYSASKAAVEAIGNTLRIELAPTGAKVGVAYFAEIDTDMTSRGFGTEAAQMLTGGGTILGVAPLSSAIDAIDRGIARRSRRICAPRWIAPILPARMLAQRVMELRGFPQLSLALQVAREEQVDLTTLQPQRLSS